MLKSTRLLVTTVYHKDQMQWKKLESEIESMILVNSALEAERASSSGADDLAAKLGDLSMGNRG